MSEVCAFTGHRVLYDADAGLLERVISDLIKGGCKRFLCGMAQGFDLLAAETVIRLNDADLVACIPCRTQSEYFPAADKIRYKNILSACSEVICLSEEYYNGCMQVRDRFMVENCDTVLSYCRKSSGGTRYTLNYAVKKGRKIVEL